MNDDIVSAVRTLLTERFKVARGLWADCSSIRALAREHGYSEREYCTAFIQSNFAGFQITFPRPVDMDRLNVRFQTAADEAFAAAATHPENRP